MSVTATTPQRHECSREGCEQEYSEPVAVDGSYCSRRCSLIDSGRDVLRNLKHDHRWCHSCFKQLKEVEMPPAGYPSFVVGFQSLTEHASFGAREANPLPSDDEAAIVTEHAPSQAPAPADRLTLNGAICECGTTDHRDAYLRREFEVPLDEAARRLCAAHEHMGQEGQHEQVLDIAVLREALWNLRRDEDATVDWALAVGYALEE